MNDTSLCYVTMFLDIGRADWKNVFKRTFEEYLKYFEPFIPLFNKKTCNNDLYYVNIFCSIISILIKYLLSSK